MLIQLSTIWCINPNTEKFNMV